MGSLETKVKKNQFSSADYVVTGSSQALITFPSSNQANPLKFHKTLHMPT